MARLYLKLSVLGQLKARGLSVLTVQATYGRAQQVATITLRSQPLKELLRQVRELRGFITTNNPPWTTEELRSLGAELFDLVIRGGVRDLYNVAIGRAAQQVLVPLEITVQDYQVAAWPWEFMYDTGRAQYICQEFNPICRSILNLDPGRDWPEKLDRARLLLLIGARPRDVRTRAEEYVEQFRKRFVTHLANGQVELRVRTDIDPSELVQELVDNPPDIVHFYGHAAIDYPRKEGYLSFERADPSKTERYYANDFAQLLGASNVRLAFLNACETAVGVEDDLAARSSIAAALLARGIPAVIATQYTMPVNSASLFSSLVYSVLASGKPLLEAVKYGRNSLRFGDKRLFCDWGIPVLYASEPELVFFPRSGPPPPWQPGLAAGLCHQDPITALSSPSDGLAPRILVEPPGMEALVQAVVDVALVDIDSGVGFLPELAERANRVQQYYHFKVAYPPVPSMTAVAQVDGQDVLVTQLDRLNEPLRNLPDALRADRVCCLTRHYISDPTPEEPWHDYLSSRLPSNKQVQFVSTFGLREYAHQAGVTYEAAVLFLCLGQLIFDEEKNREFHTRTVGCILDFCYHRDDVVAGLRHMRFDHAACRRKIDEPGLLQAIDMLLELARTTSSTAMSQTQT